MKADFEDYLQGECAKQVAANYMITRNTTGYNILDFPFLSLKSMQYTPLYCRNKLPNHSSSCLYLYNQYIFSSISENN